MLSKSITVNKYYWHNTEISEGEYEHILGVIRNRPTAPEGFAYRLTKDLEWELYELPAEDTDPELTEAEALEIILGGAH